MSQLQSRSLEVAKPADASGSYTRIRYSSSASSSIASDLSLWSASTLPTPPLASPLPDKSNRLELLDTTSSSPDERDDNVLKRSYVQLLQILACPPIATNLVRYLGRTDLPRLRLLCKFAYQSLTYSEQYYQELLESTIQCDTATDNCRIATDADRGRCIRCDKQICLVCFPTEIDL